MKRLVLVALMAIVASFGVIGCGSDSSGSGNNGGQVNQGTASQSEVNNCKEACNQQKFFDCYDAATHASCYQDCEQADSSGVELFVNCVGVEICDSECATHIEPPAPPPVPTSSDCEAACNGLVTDQCIPPSDCAAECAAAEDEAKNFLVYCEANRTGCEFPEACQFADEPNPQEECVSGCQTMGMFECISGADVSECTTICQGLDDSAASGFATCVQSSGICEDDSCYQQINEGGGSADVTGCQSACDEMSQFDCLDAATHSECRTTCESAEKAPIETFKSCVDNAGICDDSSCYDVFASN